MQTRTRGWIVVTLITCGLGATLVLRALRLEQLIGERERVRTELTTMHQQEAENQRLAGQLPSADQLAVLRADHAAVERLRSELTRLRSQAAKARLPATMAPRIEEPSRIVPSSEWTYAGRATPAAAIETVLWAAMGGDLDALAQTLWLDEAASAKATALLGSLPASSRSEYATPERLVALFTAKDLPNGAVQLVSEAKQPSGEVMMRVRLFQPDGSTRSTTLLARQKEGEWRLAVPASAIDKYGAVLQGATALK